jgi:hypothetical protein
VPTIAAATRNKTTALSPTIYRHGERAVPAHDLFARGPATGARKADAGSDGSPVGCLRCCHEALWRGRPQRREQQARRKEGGPHHTTRDELVFIHSMLMMNEQ